MAKENKVPKGIRIAASLDRKIERVQAHAGASTYNATIEWLIEAGYRYYIQENPDIMQGVGGKIPKLENMPKLK